MKSQLINKLFEVKIVRIISLRGFYEKSKVNEVRHATNKKSNFRCFKCAPERS